MGNIIIVGAKKKKSIKLMTIDGATTRLKPPATAADALRSCPSHSLLDPDDVRRLGIRAAPLDHSRALVPGKLYFLVELPRLPVDHRAPRRAWSGALRVSAKDRLESLALSRRAVSDIGSVSRASAGEEEGEGAVRVKMRLPRAQVVKLVEESRDAGEAAERIAELCVAKDLSCSPFTERRREKRTRFLPVATEITA